MKNLLILLCFIYLINLFISLPSEEILIKLKNDIIENKLLINPNKTHFLFDESNYTRLDINHKKMKILYEKQEDIYNNLKISNFIFVVDYIDENQESIELATKRLRQYLYYAFEVDIDNSIVALFSMKSRRVRISIGKKTNEKITDSDAQSMIDDLASFLRNEEYYEAWLKFVNDIKYYYNS